MPIIHKGNPFTHFEEKRESKVNYSKEYCDWCGGQPKYLFKYTNTKGWFCNKGCWMEFNN